MAGSNNKLSLADSELKSMSSSEEELQCFDQGVAKKEIKQITMVYFLIMMEELLYMREKLPELLDELKAVQKKVDDRHTNSNIATVGGCAASIAGGFLCIFGIIAAPFTFGISI